MTLNFDDMGITKTLKFQSLGKTLNIMCLNRALDKKIISHPQILIWPSNPMSMRRFF